MNLFSIWPFTPHTPANPIHEVITASESALHTAYLAGLKDGLLVAVAVFSLLFVLFRKDSHV